LHAFFLAATGEVSSAPTSWTPISKPADIALVVTVCQPVLPNSSASFRLALHPKSPSSIFYVDYDDLDDGDDDDDGSGDDNDMEDEPPLDLNWRRKKFYLRPGEQFDDEPIRGVKDLFVFGSVAQKSLKGKNVSHADMFCSVFLYCPSSTVKDTIQHFFLEEKGPFSIVFCCFILNPANLQIRLLKNRERLKNNAVNLLKRSIPLVFF
jgi:hypothetical protein